MRPKRAQVVLSGPMQQVQVKVGLPRLHLEAIDRARGDVPRNVWMRHAVVLKLETDGDAPWDPELRKQRLRLREQLEAHEDAA